MNKSMTGFGLARKEDDEKSITIEIKTLNSKYLDINLRLPKMLSEKEMELRNIIAGQLERGKISVSIEYIHKSGSDTIMKINSILFKKYYAELNELATEVEAEPKDIFRIALQYPEVVVPLADAEEKEREWAAIKEVLLDALDNCNHFRIKEGKALTVKLKSYIEKIAQNLSEVELLDPERMKAIRARLDGSLREFVTKEELDENRLEQELIYYIEKMDISEEKVRLKTHLNHFSEILDDKKPMGKKLNFVSQEIGREINTIGSKANHAGIQRMVINMKEELEKIKEQTLNLL